MHRLALRPIFAFAFAVAFSITISSVGAAAELRQEVRLARTSLLKLGKVDSDVNLPHFSRICMNGKPDCPSPSDVSAAPVSTKAWACTQDNTTKLVWSLHTGQGEWTGFARSTLPAAHNVQKRCGFASGWRLPTRRELLSIVSYDHVSPAIDNTYFPSTQADAFWTLDSYNSDSEIAWLVVFQSGHTDTNLKTSSNFVRLVHSGS